MPYKSEAQRRYFNVNRKKLEAQGVDVDEWNQASKGKKLPEKKANTPGQTGNIPVTPPTPVRPEAAPSGNIPRPARRQTTLADGRGFEAMAAKEAATPFFYLLGDLAKMTAHVKTSGLSPKNVSSITPKPKIESPFSRTQSYEDLADKATRDFTAPVANTVFKGGPGLLGLGQFPEPKPAPAPSYFDSVGEFGSKLIPSFSRLKDFATSPLGIGTGLGLGGLGALAYMNSRSREDEDEEKAAGIFSESIGAANPLFNLGPNQLGLLAAALNPTRNLKQQVAADDEMWSNLLIPGRGAYNIAKRTGAAVRSPEMLAMQKEHLRKKRQKAIEAARLQAQDEKTATLGNVAETLGAFNPLNAYGGGILGGAAALATPTRSLEEQAAHDADRTILGQIADVLVPGLGPYNAFKRLGSITRSPEIKKMRAQHALKNLEREEEDSKAAEKNAGVKALAKLAARSSIKRGSEKEADWFSGNIAEPLRSLAATIQGAAIGKQIAPGLLAGALTGGGIGLLDDPGYDEDTGKRRSRLSRMLDLGLTGSIVGGGSSLVFPGAAQVGSDIGGRLGGLLHELRKRGADDQVSSKQLSRDRDEKEEKQDRKNLGPREHAYIADSVGGRASQRTGRKLKEMHHDPENPYQGLYDRFITLQGGLGENLGERISRGSARMAESPFWRALAMLDPTSSGQQEGIVGALSGFGGGKDKAEGAKQRAAEAYVKFLKKYQDKFDPNIKTTERETPYHINSQGLLANLDSDIAGHAYMRNERPLHYWLNPLSKAGPLSELGDRGSRRIIAAQASPESTLGRFGMGAGSLATLGILPMFMGGEAAQQKLRASAVKNKLYAPEAMPEEKVAGSSVKYIAKLAARAVVSQTNNSF